MADVDVQQVVLNMREMFGGDYTRLVTDLAVAKAENSALAKGSEVGDRMSVRARELGDELSHLREVVTRLLDGPADGRKLAEEQLRVLLAETEK